MRKRASANYVAIDYGNGLRRYFSGEQVDHLLSHLGLRNVACIEETIREATREWATSLPTMRWAGSLKP